ncbi:syncytin-2-like [Ambystoma mexicanum]|uniref:syncytin-2-like n=1 Tax=Ambystoma mexicanum TaxID=8296 RepID=UPI0037E8CE68
MNIRTAVIMDHYWVCASKAYIRLPKDWGGICTLVNVHVPALVIPKGDLNIDSFSKADAHLRKKRSMELINRIKRENYFSAKSIEAFDAIPYEHRLFSQTSSVFTLIFMPRIQVGENTKWLKITRWELLWMINTTIKGFNAIREELRVVRLMTLQNRYVLDMITAMDGGVFAKIGESCCTCIPSHDDENGTLTEAIDMLMKLHAQMIEEVEDIADDSWFVSLFSWVPQWMADMFKFLGALLLLAMLGFCVIKIIISQCRKTAKKAIGMKIMIDVEPGWKPKDLTDEEIRDFVKTSIHAPEGTKFLYPKDHKKYVGRWIYCSQSGQCMLMTWNKDKHVKSAGCLK